MITKEILFTGYKTAELVDREIQEPGPHQVLVEMEYTAISAGTEKANLLSTPNRGDIVEALPPEKAFPVRCGYSGVGRVAALGAEVNTLRVGQRVVTCWGTHAKYNLFPEKNVIPVDQENVDSKAAAFAMICGISLGGVRKTKPEIGESLLVMGQGIIGIFATAFAHLAGGLPVIAADVNPERLSLAREMGADYALNPTEPGFAAQVKALTRGRGANIVIEVTGIDAALNQSLDCVAHQGRVSLLGCTRIPDTGINFYQKVHRTGVQLIGAHTMVKPDWDSYPGYWTCRDDMVAYLDMLSLGRLDMTPFLQHIHAPKEAGKVFAALCEDPDFPVGVLIDWKQVDN